MKYFDTQAEQLNRLSEKHIEDLSDLANEVQNDIKHIYKAIQDLQDVCQCENKLDDQLDKFINTDIISDIKDILRKLSSPIA